MRHSTAKLVCVRAKQAAEKNALCGRRVPVAVLACARQSRSRLLPPPTWRISLPLPRSTGTNKISIPRAWREGGVRPVHDTGILILILLAMTAIPGFDAHNQSLYTFLTLLGYIVP
ncbi:hypothetical protein BGY98DRAFT_1098981 [Russula aff. rugulosa BPL654]|nr:hypothetical protein BGY98DRAFT_1098981 [Russula aff. rugulosa BPL654]